MSGAPIVDNMVLAMFVDSGNAALLTALAGGEVHLSPSILDPLEWPPRSGQAPTSEFIKGMARFASLTDERSRTRLGHRERFVRTSSGLWHPLFPTEAELRLAHVLSSREERQRAKARDTTLKVARIDLGEAECAAIAIRRNVPFWSDDSGMVPLLRTLYPQVPVLRTCALVAQAINSRFLTFPQGYELYELVFKGELDLRSKAELRWEDGRAVCVLPP